MLPTELQSSREVARTLAQRIRALRLEREWTQEELADRAGIALSTYRRFERTGRVSLERLLRIALVLGALPQFDPVFRPPPASSLDELESRGIRQRGKRSDAKT